ncbi:MarR family EPS-associated transcriptional regulator [Porticoccaceae bacterium]|nr:MarR family EPS-associated transcriptional regulator [Porticoccaceae bacterium]
MPNDEIQLSVLRLLEKNPRLTQRQLSAKLGVSLGKTHYVVKSLIDVGLIKLDNFQRSNNKLGYAYLLTPKGIAEKAAFTVRFLARKQDEYKRLEQEIEMLRSEVDAETDGTDGTGAR